jgi:hypothetical protein
MRWAFGVESIKEAHVIDDESTVLRDDLGNEIPACLIGNKAGKLDVGELDGYREGAALLRFLMSRDRREG